MKKFSEIIKESNDMILFADLDGTLIETKSGETFGKDKNDWKLKEDVMAAIYSMNPLRIHIVTNQGGIPKGFITEKDFITKIQNVISKMMKSTGCNTITYDYCPSEDKSDPKRKPNTGMIDDFFKNNKDISRSKCIMIGDASGKTGQFSDSDIKCANAAGIPYFDVEDFIKKYVTV